MRLTRTKSSIVTEESQNEEGRIDLNKYEGHTPGPWVWAKYPETETLKWCLTRKRENSMGLYIPDTFCYLAKFQQPLENWNIHAQNYKLIADAPLLLEEVKRLRKGIRHIIEEMQTWTEEQVGKPLFRMFIDELKEVIE